MQVFFIFLLRLFAAIRYPFQKQWFARRGAVGLTPCPQRSLGDPGKSS